MDIVATAIAHIAHLVDALSAILNIPLLHPLLPCQASDSMVSAQQNLWARAQVTDCCYSLAPVTFSSEPVSFQEFDWTALGDLSVVITASAATSPNISIDRHATVKNNNSIGIHGILREYTANTNFPVALALLQANIVSLCLSAGISADTLWPAEAMLLNLHLLQQHYEQTVTASIALSLLATAGQGAPLVHAETDEQAVRRRCQEVLHSIRDRYGSHAAAHSKHHTTTESVYIFGEGGKSVRADFSPESSGLARDDEWDIIHMNK